MPELRLSAWIIVIASLLAIARELGAPGWISVGSIILIGIYILLEYTRLVLFAKITFFVCLAYLAFLLFSGSLTYDIVVTAAAKGSFFAWFIVALEVLREAAGGSPLIMRSGKLVIEQPPGRRYAVLTLSTHFFSILLNLGAINLLGTMTKRSIDAGRQEAGDRVSDIRLQRMLLALFRGFCSNTLWSPTSVTVVLVLAAIPGLSWYEYAPFGITLASTYLLTGWLLDRISYQRPTLTYSREPLIKVLKGLMPLLLLITAMLAMVILVSQMLDIRLIASLLISLPLLSLIWIYWQQHSLARDTDSFSYRERLGRKLLPSFPELRSEATIMCSAVFFGGLVLSQIDIILLGQKFSAIGLGDAGILLLMQWSVFLVALVGLNPIVTIAISVEIIARLPGYSIAPWLLAVTGISTWALSTGFSPLAAANRLAARLVDRTASEVGIRWNGLFTLILMILLSLLIIMADYFG